MDINFGDNLKRLRAERGITQQSLADFLGISFQAVSKWERNESYPDIAIIPLIASYFNISIDDLLGYSIKDINAEIESICNNADKYRESNYEKGREIIENGLVKYPNNDVLLDRLLYFVNYNENPDLTISIAKKLIKFTRSNDLKYDGYRFLAYSTKGDTDKSIEYLKKVPQLYFTQYSEMAFILEGKPKYEAAYEQKWNSFEILLQMMWKIAEFHLSENDIENAISETEKAIELIEVFKNDEKSVDFENYKQFFESKLNEFR